MDGGAVGSVGLFGTDAVAVVGVGGGDGGIVEGGCQGCELADVLPDEELVVAVD